MLSFRVCSIAHPYLVIQTGKILNILFNYGCIKRQQAAYLHEWIRKENKQVGFIHEKEYMVSTTYFLSGNISQLA